jgi:hypothetical protein
MKQSTPDFTAGRIQPSQYDTVLPPDARAEFFIPKRSVILGRTSSQREYQFGIFKWVGGFALCAIILAGVIAHHSQSLKTPATPQHAAPVVQPTPAPQKPLQEPLVKPAPVSQPLMPPPPAVSALRARLVRLPSTRGTC